MGARARIFVLRTLLTAAACICVLCGVATFAQTASSRNEPSQADVARAVERARSKEFAEAEFAESVSLGQALLRAGRHADAAELFVALASARPAEPLVSYGAALALFNLGRADEAEPFARAAVKHASSTNRQAASTSALKETDALVLLAVVQAVAGDEAGAMSSAARAVELAPDNFDAQFTLGRALYGAGDSAGAARAFRAAVALRPDDARSRFFLATALERAGDSDAALAAYRELVARHPRAAEGHLGLGVLLIKRGGDDDETGEGIESLKRALSLKPDLYEARVTLGRALVASGRHVEALPHLRRAAELAPGNPEPHYQLAIAYRRLGRREEATAETEKVKRIHEARRSGARNQAATPP